MSNAVSGDEKASCQLQLFKNRKLAFEHLLKGSGSTPSAAQDALNILEQISKEHRETHCVEWCFNTCQALSGNFATVEKYDAQTDKWETPQHFEELKHVTAILDSLPLVMSEEAKPGHERQAFKNKMSMMEHYLLAAKSEPKAAKGGLELLEQLSHQYQSAPKENEWFGGLCEGFSDIIRESGVSENIEKATQLMEIALAGTQTSAVSRLKAKLFSNYQTLVELYQPTGPEALGNAPEALRCLQRAIELDTSWQACTWHKDAATKIAHTLLPHYRMEKVREIEDFKIQLIETLEEQVRQYHAESMSLEEDMLTMVVQNIKCNTDAYHFALKELFSEHVETLKVDKEQKPESEVLYFYNMSDFLMSKNIDEQCSPDLQRENIRVGYTSMDADEIARNLINKPDGAAEEIFSDPRSHDSVSAADRILFYTSTDPEQLPSLAEAIKTFALTMRSTPETKVKDWSRVRFLIHYKTKDDPSEMEAHRAHVISTVNRELKTLGIELDESHFVCACHPDPTKLPESRRGDVDRLLTFAEE